MTDDIARERMLELLADRAIFGLNASESAELEELALRYPELASDASFEKASAAYSIATLGAVEELPASLRSRLDQTAAEMFAASEAPSSVPVTPEPAPIASVSYDKPAFSLSQWLGWGVAFAAVALLAINVWMTRVQPGNEQAANLPTPEPTAQQQTSPADKMQQLASSAKDAVLTNWTPPAKDGDVSGEVVWSDAEQKGYMTFKGLPENDPSKEQYQLWIFDDSQDEATPIDGGVFNVNKKGEVVVPIDAKLKVDHPKMFAVTVEKPGGVVVSDRKRIVAIAKV